jgi:hypothetical protein
MAAPYVPPSMPLLSLSSERTIAACANPPVFEQGPTVFIASYPKSGTTWTQNIVVQLLNLRKGFDFQHISDFAPFYEIDKNWEEVDGEYRSKGKFADNHNRLGTRVFTTHLRWHMLPKSENYKHIYVYRRGKDVAVSFHKHLSNQVGDGFEGSLSEFVTAWTSGTLPYGRWVDHVHEWRVASLAEPSNNILMLAYEDMLVDLPSALRKIAAYLNVDISEDELVALVPKLTFDGMKAELARFHPISVQWKEGYEFLRHGVSGDGQELFSQQDTELFNRMVQDSEIYQSDPVFIQSLMI